MDFFGIWSWARFEIEQPPARIYDYAAAHDFLLSLDPEFPVPMPFPYPPPYLLLIRPLGWLSYPVAQAIWSGGTLLAYVAALWGREARLLTALLALLVPATMVNLLYGQNGFLTAALLVGGIRLAPARPVLGGILLGLLSYKPQFGVLVAVALAAATLWRTALAAAVTVAVMMAASLLAFGTEPWTAWFRSIPEFAAIVYQNRARLLHLMPTALSDALALGTSEPLAVVIQATVAIAVATGVWFVFRRASGKAPAAALAAASVLASPYAFIYDLTLTAAAVTLVTTEFRMVFSTAEILVLAAALLLPLGILLNLLLSLDVMLPVATVINGALFGMILLRLGLVAPARLTERQRIKSDG
jgi:hypothetical protein